MDVASLTRNRHSLLVHRSFLAVKVENALSVGGEAAAVSAVEEVAADHDARPALAGLAVHGGDVAVVLRQPGMDVFAEGTDQ